MGHVKTQKSGSQLDLIQKTHWKFRFCHGGSLRLKRRGRGARPLSTRQPVHLVFKAEKKNYRRGLRSPLGFAIVKRVIKTYARRFFVKVDQVAICNDHIHLVVRLSKRSLGQHFFRVVAGQIAQNFIKEGMLKTEIYDPTLPKIKRHRKQVTDTPPGKPPIGANHAESTKKPSIGEQKEPTEPQILITKKLWKFRPFTRVIQGYKAYLGAMNYVRLNEKEARGDFLYQPKRLKGLSSYEWQLLWE